MAERIEVRAPAKVNLFLEVLGKRHDGYHELESIFQAVSLADEITVERARGHGMEFTCSHSEIEGPDNLAVRAARVFGESAGQARGYRIHLRKRIPVGGGLGGGSSDAAAVLKALNILEGDPFTVVELHSMAERLGSDVPFFLYGGTALVRGRGERVEPLEAAPEYAYVIWYPGFGVSTGEVYKNLSLKLTDERKSANVLSLLFAKGEADAATEHFFNRLEETAYALEPRLREAGAAMHRAIDNRIMLSGSGASLFSAFVDYGRAYKAYKVLQGEGRGEVFLARSDRGRGNTGSAKGVGSGDF